MHSYDPNVHVVSIDLLTQSNQIRPPNQIVVTSYGQANNCEPTVNLSQVSEAL